MTGKRTVSLTPDSVPTEPTREELRRSLDQLVALGELEIVVILPNGEPRYALTVRGKQRALELLSSGPRPLLTAFAPVDGMPPTGWRGRLVEVDPNQCQLGGRHGSHLWWTGSDLPSTPLRFRTISRCGGTIL